jgi:hypothetical protein
MLLVIRILGMVILRVMTGKWKGRDRGNRL